MTVREVVAGPQTGQEVEEGEAEGEAEAEGERAVHLAHPSRVLAVVVTPQKMAGEVAVGPQIGEQMGEEEEGEGVVYLPYP